MSRLGQFRRTSSITKSLTIDCAGTHAEINTSLAIGILVNAGPRTGLSFATSASPQRRALQVFQRALTAFAILAAANSRSITFSYPAWAQPTPEDQLTRRPRAPLRQEQFILANERRDQDEDDVRQHRCFGDQHQLQQPHQHRHRGRHEPYVGVSGSVFSAIYGYGINAANNTSTVYANDNVFTINNVGLKAAVAGAKINATGNKFFGNSNAFNVVAGATFFSGGDNKYDIIPATPQPAAWAASNRRQSRPSGRLLFNSEKARRGLDLRGLFLLSGSAACLLRTILPDSPQVAASAGRAARSPSATEDFGLR